MTAGLALTLVFPRFAHANWVLLTIALIMRANYSVTSQRRWDRVTGTLIGCALAVSFINTLPAAVLLLFIVLAVGTSHAYGMVAYRVTAVAPRSRPCCCCISSIRWCIRNSSSASWIR